MSLLIDLWMTIHWRNLPLMLTRFRETWYIRPFWHRYLKLYKVKNNYRTYFKFVSVILPCLQKFTILTCLFQLLIIIIIYKLPFLLQNTWKSSKYEVGFQRFFLNVLKSLFFIESKICNVFYSSSELYKVKTCIPQLPVTCLL